MPSSTEPAPPDGFLGGRLLLSQPLRGHRAGLDAVMLAAAIPVATGDTVLDAGTGAGIVGLCIARRVPGVRVTGVEIDAALSALANANALANGLQDAFQAICADVTLPITRLAGLGLRVDSYAAVVANPPFWPADGGTLPSDPARRRASVMPPGGLDAWLRFMTAMAAPGGVVALVFPAAGLGALLAAMEGRCGALAVLPLHPRAGAPASRVIVAGRKGSRAPLQLRPGLVLHGDGTAFTPAAEAVLRHGQALDLKL